MSKKSTIARKERIVLKGGRLKGSPKGVTWPVRIVVRDSHTGKIVEARRMAAIRGTSQVLDRALKRLADR